LQRMRMMILPPPTMPLYQVDRKWQMTLARIRARTRLRVPQRPIERPSFAHSHYRHNLQPLICLTLSLIRPPTSPTRYGPLLGGWTWPELRVYAVRQTLTAIVTRLHLQVVQPWIPELSSPPQLHFEPAFATPTSPQNLPTLTPRNGVESMCTTVPCSHSSDSALSPQQLSADIDFVRLEIIKPPVGMGSFKIVYKALLDGSNPVAALSVCKQSARSALAEVQILQVGTANL